MLDPNIAPRSVLGFREFLTDITEVPAEHDILVLAVDGLSARIADGVIFPSTFLVVNTVFPTNSFPGWLSSLTGVPVAEHGVPGVVFMDSMTGAPVDLARGSDDCICPHVSGTIFTDASQRGLRPIAVLNDMTGWMSGVTRAMLRGAEHVEGRSYFSGSAMVAPVDAISDLRCTLQELLPDNSGRERRLIWMFIELDKRIHSHGYDAAFHQWLQLLGELAEEYADKGCKVVLHSDHGLVRTTHSPDLSCGHAKIVSKHGLSEGGAGRARWLYMAPDQLPEVVDEVSRLFGQAADVYSRDDLFLPGSAGWRAIGQVVFVARSSEFITPAGSVFEHGSLLSDEIHVPLMLWD